MNNTTLKDAILAALVGSTALQAWSQGYFNQQVSVFDGIERNQLPDPLDEAASVSGDYPFIAVDLDTKESGPGSEIEAVEVSFFAALLDDHKYDASSFPLIRLPGIKKREAMRLLLLAAVKGVDLDGGRITTIESVNLPVEYFPEFAVDITIRIERPYVFRDNNFE